MRTGEQHDRRLISTWERVRRGDEVVGAELLGRLEGLVAEVEADAHDLGAVEVGAAAGGEELDLHLHVGVAVEQGVLQEDGARGERQLRPQHALQRLERRAVADVAEEGRPEVHDPLVRERARAALRAQALPRRARPREALHQARRVGRRRRPLRQVAVRRRVGQPRLLAHRVPGQPEWKPKGIDQEVGWEMIMSRASRTKKLLRRAGAGHSREGAVVAGGHDEGGELVVLEAHQAELTADAPAHVQGAVERVAVEDPAKQIRSQFEARHHFVSQISLTGIRFQFEGW